MQISERLEFAASCDRVYAMSIDPAFLRQVCADLDSTPETLEVTPIDSGVRTSVLAAVKVPSPMDKFAGPTSRISQVMDWGAADADGSRTARLTITVPGMPVTVDASARLAPTASGCAIDYDGTFSINVPFVGPVVEQQAAPFILDTLNVQQRSGNAWLASHS